MWNRKDLIGLHNLYNRICTINKQIHGRREVIFVTLRMIKQGSLLSPKNTAKICLELVQDYTINYEFPTQRHVQFVKYNHEAFSIRQTKIKIKLLDNQVEFNLFMLFSISWVYLLKNILHHLIKTSFKKQAMKPPSPLKKNHIESVYDLMYSSKNKGTNRP